MKKSLIIFLCVSGACTCIMLGIFIARNFLPTYAFQPIRENEQITGSTQNAVSGKININTATEDELMQLPGIGKVTAQNIIQYRADYGAFATVEDLLNVKGIGYGTLYNIQDLITVGG